MIPTQSAASATQPPDGVLKVITFTAAKQLLALPIAAVLRVINCPPALDEEGCLISLEGQVLSLIRLDRLLSSSAQRRDGERFLIIAQDSGGRCCAIAIADPPNLVELPIATLQPLPDGYRQDGSGLVSHVAVWTQAQQTRTIFLIDLESERLSAAKAPAERL